MYLAITHTKGVGENNYIAAHLMVVDLHYDDNLEAAYHSASATAPLFGDFNPNVKIKMMDVVPNSNDAIVVNSDGEVYRVQLPGLSRGQINRNDPNWGRITRLDIFNGNIEDASKIIGGKAISPNQFLIALDGNKIRTLELSQ